MSLGLWNNLKHSIHPLNSFFLLLHHHHDIYGASLQLSADCLRKDSILESWHNFLHHGHLHSDELRNTAAMNMIEVNVKYTTNILRQLSIMSCSYNCRRFKYRTLRYVHNPAVILLWIPEDPESPAKNGAPTILEISVRIAKPPDKENLSGTSPDSYPVTSTSIPD